MPVKQRTSNTPGTTYVRESGTEGPSRTIPISKQFMGEFIQYGVGRHKVNPCSHYRYVVRLGGSLTGTKIRRRGSLIDYDWVDGVFAPSYFPGLAGEVPALSPSFLDLKRKILGFKPVDNFVNAFELDDLIRLKNIFKDGNLVNAFLAGEFAIKPLITDVLNLLRNIKKIYTTDLYKSHQQWQTCSFKEVKSGSLTQTRWNDFDHSSEWRYHIVYDNVSRFTCRYRYFMPKTLVNDLSLVARSIGFIPTAKTPWDLIPFSFIADWFLPIGKILDRVEYDPLDLKIEVKNCCSSVKRTSLWTSSCIRDEYFESKNLIGLMGYQGTNKSYIRNLASISDWAYTPQSFSFDASDAPGLNAERSAELAALASQRLSPNFGNIRSALKSVKR